MMKAIKANPISNQRGQGIIWVLIGSICLLTSLLALASSISFVQAMNSSNERRTNAEDFIRGHLQAIKGTIQTAGGVTLFARSIEPNSTVYNPVLTTDLSDPTKFNAAFGFKVTDTVSIHNTSYTWQFSVAEYKIDSNLVLSSFVLNVDHLRDLAYIKFAVDLTPVNGGSGNGSDGPSSRHGEIYVAQ